MVRGSIQDQSMVKYMQKFKRWQEFCQLSGQIDEFIRDLTSILEKTLFICAWAAWIRASGRWCGDTTIQGLAVVRTLMIHNFVDHAVFDSAPIKALRRSLSLTDWFDEARENKEGRLPYTLDMVHTSAMTAVLSNDINTIMTGTAISTASLLLLRIGEYGEAPTGNDPDHRLVSKNVGFYLRGKHSPLTPHQLRAHAIALGGVNLTDEVESVSLTLAGSKTDKKRHGITFSFAKDDLDMDDPTNAIAMWTRWACIVDHDDDDPFFSYRNRSNQRTDMSAAKVTEELRRVGRLHHIPEHQLYRLTPHSIRIGMATHLHNIGVTTTVILQMGRWSPKSSAAPRYQHIGKGACAQVAASTTRHEKNKNGPTSQDTIRTLVHVDTFRAQYKKAGRRGGKGGGNRPSTGKTGSSPTKDKA